MVAPSKPQISRSLLVDKVGLLEKNDKRLLLFLFFLFLGVIYLLFLKKDQLFPTETKVIGVINTKSHIRLKRNGTLTWSNAYNGEKIFSKDMVFIPPQVVSSISLEKETWELPEDTLIHFDEVMLENLIIYLRESAKPVSLLPKKVYSMRIEKNLPDITPLIERLSELRQRTYDKVFSPRQLQGAQPVNGKLQEFLLADFNIDLVKPTAGQVINTYDEKTLQFLWSKIPLKKVSYTIELSQDSGFQRALQFTTNKGNQLFVQLDKPGPYFWRIKAKFQEDKVVSGTSNFFLENALRDVTNK